MFIPAKRKIITFVLTTSQMQRAKVDSPWRKCLNSIEAPQNLVRQAPVKTNSKKIPRYCDPFASQCEKIQMPTKNMTLEEKIRLVLPRQSEERFLEIPWHTDLLVARKTAESVNKPLFIWIMDGNVLGATLGNGHQSRVLLNQEKIVDFIKQNFIAGSGAVEELQTNRYGSKENDESKWFEPIAQKALKRMAPQFWKEFKSYQGMYIIDPDGTIYDYKIGLAYDPDHFLKVLNKSLRKYRIRHRTTRAQKKAVPIKTTHSKKLAPKDVSIVEVYSRILPQPKNASISERSIGRDLMWIYPEDISAILSSAKLIGNSVKMPSNLVARLIRFQLLNHVGNIMGPFSNDEVKQANFILRRQPDLIQAGKSLKRYSFSGIYQSRGKYEKSKFHALSGSISGYLTIDPGARRIVHLRAFGEAKSLGGNDSLDEKKTYPVVFALTEARHKYARSVIPFWVAIPAIEKMYKNPSISLNN